MFDFSFTEMLLAGVVALVVLGPERLPKVARKAGEWGGKIQRLASSVKTELMTHGEYAEFNKVKQDFVETATEIKQDLQTLGKQVDGQGQEIARQVEADTRPAWKKLPEQKTPADFGIPSAPADKFDYTPQKPALGLNAKSLRKQAMSRKRDLRPRFRPAPKLRSRR